MTITIHTQNAAFDADKGYELAAMLEKIAQKLRSEGTPEHGNPWPIMDTNGNRVGKVAGR